MLTRVMDSPSSDNKKKKSFFSLNIHLHFLIFYLLNKAEWVGTVAYINMPWQFHSILILHGTWCFSSNTCMLGSGMFCVSGASGIWAPLCWPDNRV